MNLTIKELSYEYKHKAGNQRILENVDLVIEDTGIITIEGENGSGKTTFLKLLATILDIQSGSIELDGVKAGENEYKKYTGYVPDTPILYDELSGKEHIELFCELWEMKGEERINYRQKVEELSIKLGLSGYLNQKIRTFSLGTRYKLFYVLMLARKLKMLMLDEPFSSLDVNSQTEAKDMLKKISDSTIIIISSHQKELISELADRHYEIINKRIISK